MAYPKPSGGFAWAQAPWGKVLRCTPMLSVADHFFTAGDLQLRDDEREWAAVAQEIGVERDKLLLVRQVHRTDVSVARRGEGTPRERPEADLLLTDDPARAIAVRVADCAPILLADRRTGVVAAIHAGWRGTVAGAAVTGVEALARAFGSRPADLLAAIGPCLGPCCGEVGEEVRDAFRAAGHADAALARWFSPGAAGRPYLDLWTANADQLAQSGIPADQIHVARLCTRTHADVLHSHRAARERAGRMAAVIRTGG